MRGLWGWPAVAGLAALAVYFNDDGALGIVAVTWFLAYVCFFGMRRLLVGPSGVGARTGRTLMPDPAISALEAGSVAIGRWGGGAQLPWLYDQIHAAAPLAVLELTGSSVTVRVRPRVLALGLQAAVTLDADDVDAIFPIKTRLAGYEGIGLRRTGGAVTYFWSSRREEMLSALTVAGFPVRWEERNVRT
jgi:hypothetical protein